MNDKLSRNYQTALNTVKANKRAAIEMLLAQGKKDEVINILKNNKRFEMKFENVRASTHIHYKAMVDIFLSDNRNRFSAVVVDKDEPTYDQNFIHDAWEAYTGFSAGLTVRAMTSIPSEKLCIILDEISKPNVKLVSLENSFLKKARLKIEDQKARDVSLSFNNVFGALSIESHSNLLLQLCDVLLGAVMYDFKKKCGITSSQTQARKEVLTAYLRSNLGVTDLARTFTRSTPAHFSVKQARFNRHS